MDKQKVKAAVVMVRGVGQIISGVVAVKKGKSVRARACLDQGRKKVQEGIKQLAKKKS